jgi:hypothetical protein
MKPAEIGEIISIIVWFINFILRIIAKKIGDEVNANFFNSIELMALGFMWIFIGFNHGWW